MENFKKVISFIFNPFKTFGLGKFSDRVIEVVNNNKYIIYIFSFVITILILFLRYFI